MENAIEFKTILNYTLLGGMIFVLGALIGYIGNPPDPSISSHYVYTMSYEDSSVAHYLSYGTRLLTIWFFNSLLALSILTVGRLPSTLRLLCTPIGCYNGVKIGMQVPEIIQTYGSKALLWSVLPHGILELSSIFVCIGLGMMFSYKITIGKCKDLNYTCDAQINAAYHIYFTYLVPILFIAATIETFISPVVLHRVAGF